MLKARIRGALPQIPLLPHSPAKAFSPASMGPDMGEGSGGPSPGQPPPVVTEVMQLARRSGRT